MCEFSSGQFSQDGFQSSERPLITPSPKTFHQPCLLPLKQFKSQAIPTCSWGSVKCSWSLLMQPVWNWAKGGCITCWLSDWEWSLCEVNPGVWGHILQRSQTADLKALYTWVCHSSSLPGATSTPRPLSKDLTPGPLSKELIQQQSQSLLVITALNHMTKHMDTNSPIMQRERSPGGNSISSKRIWDWKMGACNCKPRGPNYKHCVNLNMLCVCVFWCFFTSIKI